MKYDEKMTPIGCNPPKKAEDMPWKPISGGVETNFHAVKPFCKLSTAAKPAKAPDIPVAMKMFLILLIPA